MTTYDPHGKYLEQPWHTIDTLRTLAREQDALITQLYADRAARDAVDVIDRTPNAWRIYGTIADLIGRGYDANHIVGWLIAGRAREERDG